MSIQTTLGESQPHLSTNDKQERDVIFTANGSARASREVRRAGALVGFNSLNQRPPEDIPVEFVDWPFNKVQAMDDPDLGELFDAHLKTVRAERPRYAVAPDVNKFTQFEDVVEWAEELQHYADTVIMVPKAVLPTDIPPGFRVGMPCQERFGPPPWRWTQYRECGDVHLLGGSPVKHHEILKHYIEVESVDTTVPVTSAGWGDYWNGQKWESIGFQGDHFYPCLRRSYRNMRQSLNSRRRVWEPRARNRREDYEDQFRDGPDGDLWGPGERPPSPAYELRYGSN